MTEHTNTAAAEKKAQTEFSTKLSKMNDALAPMIERQLTQNGIVITDYQRQCILAGIAAVNSTLDKAGLTYGSPKFDNRNMTEMLQTIACLQLNAAATPREIYFQTRNVKVKTETGEDWKTQIEMGIEGDGNDSILRRFGAGVQEVAQFWQVREGDKFTYPKYKGFESTPPEWEPTGNGKIVRIVYPILKKTGAVEFHIAEREDVKKNLAAHISNNLMNETFGICKKRFDATQEQLKEIAKRKQAVLAKITVGTIDEVLDNPELADYISPAWREPNSRESMIVRKMRNNIVKKIPKDFSNAYIATTYMNATDDTKMLVDSEIAENANGDLLDIQDAEYAHIQTDPETGEVLEESATEEQGDAGHEATAASDEAEDGQTSMFPGDAKKGPSSKSKKDPF